MSRIVIVEHRPEWEQEFAKVANEIRSATGDSVLRIDHIGSTSVKGLAAKDVIDIQITVGDLDDQTYVRRLINAGFRLRDGITTDVLVGTDETGDSGSKELRKRYFRERERERKLHIHVREKDRVNQRYALLFRDYLRENPSVRRAYEMVKRRLAELFPNDIDVYLSIKDPFMDVIFEGAQHWAVLTNWSASNDHY